MTKCPTCQTDLNEDFGLATCASCGTVSFIDLDGNAHLQEDHASSDEDISEEGSAEAQGETIGEAEEIYGESSEDASYDIGAGTNLAEGDYSEDYNADLSYGTADDGDGSSDFNESSSSDFDEAEEDSDPTYFSEEGSEDEVLMEGDLPDEGTADFSYEDSEEPLEEELIAEGVEAVRGPSSNSEPMAAEDFFSEIETFGAIDSEPFQEGAYFFDIEVTGIDSVDIRNEIVESLSDSKLGLDELELSKRIKGGALMLPQIQAVKASIIIQRLSGLNCELDWTLKEVQDLGIEVPEDEADEIESHEVAQDLEDPPYEEDY